MIFRSSAAASLIILLARAIDNSLFSKMMKGSRVVKLAMSTRVERKILFSEFRYVIATKSCPMIWAQKMSKKIQKF